MSRVPIVCAGIFLCCLASSSQQQTGSPAGVPVPPARTASDGSDAGERAPGTLHFRVHVVDGRNGALIRNAHVKLWYDEPSGPGYEVATDAHGDANMPAPVGEPVRVLVAITDYTDCRKALRGGPPPGYSLGDIAHSGLATQNTCGQLAVHPRPGELVLFARTPRWYEGINRGTGN